MDIEKSPAWRMRPRSRRRLTRYLLGFVVFIFCFQWYVVRRVSSGRAGHGGSASGRIQYAFTKNTGTGALSGGAQTERLRAVKQEFMHAWSGYKEFAWMADSLKPLTAGKKNQFCGWSATLVDALDTLWIMGLRAEFEEALTAALTINFASSTCEMNTFETTIRYLGGLVAAYDLSGDERLVLKIAEIGELIHSAFNSTNGMPCGHCNFQKMAQPIEPPKNAVLADVGTFYLELARLSQITGQKKYMDTVDLLTNVFERTQGSSNIPGLWPESVDTSSIAGRNALFAVSSGPFSLGAMSDSAYEYLVKTHLLLGGKTKQYARMWKNAASPIREHLLFRANIPEVYGGNILFSGLATKGNSGQVSVEARTQHLACFAGGMFAMAARIFDEPEDLTIGEGLTNGCVWAYEQTPTGIMPETFSLQQCPDQHTQCAWNATSFSEASGIPEDCLTGDCDGKQQRYPAGFLYSIDDHYALRPEAIESVFIMYRITGEPRWREVGWRMFQSIIKNTRTQHGHAALSSTLQVTNRTIWEEDGPKDSQLAGRQNDDMESFWLAETLKYFWLLFSDPEVVSLDDWVLNTEAHPIRLDKKLRGFP